MMYRIYRNHLLLGLAAILAAVTAHAGDDNKTPAAPAADEKAAVSAGDEKAADVNLESELAKQCYATGAMIGMSVSEPGLELDVDAFMAGLSAALRGEKLAMEEGDLHSAFIAMQQKLRASMQEKAAAMADKAKTEGAAYLAANAKKEGVKVTDSGLQYKVIEEGEGASPTDSDKVEVRYKGMFVDGKVFDQSGDKPASFGVTQVIPGWTEALKMMKPGAKWELAIPSDLAYGPSGRGTIPPNSTLLFEVELVGIVK